MKHLADDQIQNYLDGGLPKGAKAAAELHLENCRSCQMEMKRYKALLKTLRNEDEFHLPAQFSAVVVSKIKKEALGSVQKRLWQIFMALCGIIIVINTTLYYYNIKPIIEKVKNFNLSFDFLQQYITPFKTFLSAFQNHQKIDYHLMIVVAVIMLILALIDRFIFRSKNKFVTFV
jgi:hypothetical protein